MNSMGQGAKYEWKSKKFLETFFDFWCLISCGEWFPLWFVLWKPFGRETTNIKISINQKIYLSIAVNCKNQKETKNRTKKFQNKPHKKINLVSSPIRHHQCADFFIPASRFFWTCHTKHRVGWLVPCLARERHATVVGVAYENLYRRRSGRRIEGRI